MKIWLESETGADMTYNFYPAIDTCGLKHIQLLQCTLYNSWYNVTPANNVLRFRKGREGTKTMTLTPGNYNIETLNEAIDLPNNLTFHKHGPTGRVRLKLSNDWQVMFDYKRNFARLVGFNAEQTSTGKLGPRRANFITVSEYIVHCDAIDRADNYVGGATDARPADYLQVLPLRDTKEVCEKVIYDIARPLAMPLKNADFLSSMRIWITDQEGRKIDFNGFPVSVCIELL